MTEKSEEIVPLSDDGDAGDCDDGTVSPPPVTVPKKRGRPSNPDKPKKVVTTSGRGRGRPAKGGDGAVNKKPAKRAASADGSQEEGTGSDGDSPITNGDGPEAPTAVASKRGRKPKGKRKLNHIVEVTGKGRGRPKKVIKTDDNDDDDAAADDNDDGASSDHKIEKKSATKAAKKGRGRPKKVQSDDESSDDKQDDYEERRPVGRPSSGGVNLNVVRTGRGQGRPKKNVDGKRTAETSKRAAETENGGVDVPKQRGRPSTSGKGAHSPTGKPRGRPKLAVENKDSQDDEDDDVSPSKEGAVENIADDDDENNKVNSESDDDI